MKPMSTITSIWIKRTTSPTIPIIICLGKSAVVVEMVQLMWR